MNRSRRVMMILLAAAGLLAVALWLGVGESRLFRFSPNAPAPIEAEQGRATAAARSSATTVMVKPRYTGQDSAGQIWEVTADSATQSGTMASSTMSLENVNALWQSPGQQFKLAANRGNYDMQQKTLHLQGDVVVVGEGVTVSTPEAHADLATRAVKGDQGVKAEGVLGGYQTALTGQSFEVGERGKHLTVQGNVHVELVK